MAHPAIQNRFSLSLRMAGFALLLFLYGCNSQAPPPPPAPSTLSADFSFSTSPANPLGVSFREASTGPVDTWRWNFGDGALNNTSANPAHTYATAGSYVVILEVTDSAGASDTSTQRVTVYQQPGADFQFRVDPNDTQVLTFSGAAARVYGTPLGGSPPAPSISDWTWDLGDGTTLSGQSVSHRFASQGSFNVTLRTRGPGGVNSSTQTVVVGNPAPVADFTPLASAVDPQDLDFQDRSIGVIADWAWDFGDGAASAARNPGHVYAHGGSYPVSLTVTGPGGTSTTTHTIKVGDRQPSPSIAHQVGGTTAPFTVQFAGSAAERVTDWTWDFGDFTQSSLRNPTHQYTSAGSYVVGLQAIGPGGLGDAMIRLNLGVSGPTVDFRDQQTAGGFYDMEFAPLVSGVVDRLEIRFGDGDMQTLTPANPSAPAFTPVTHSYAAAGSYTVTMEAFSPLGDVHVSRSVAVTEPPLAPAVAIRPATGGPAPLTLQFDGSAAGNVQTWDWDFGDGNSAAGEDVTHTYQRQGHYTARLTVSGPGGILDSVSRPVSVAAVQTRAVAAATPMAGAVPFTVSFSNRSVGDGPLAHAWTFGDGGSSTAAEPVHTYTLAGNHAVTLTVTDAQGIGDSTNLTVSAQAVPLAAAIGAPVVQGPAPLTVDFKDDSAGTVSEWEWDFGDATPTVTTTDPAIGREQTHVYSQPGQYAATLRIRGPLPAPGDQDSNRVIIQVSPAAAGLPDARIAVTPSFGAAPLAAAFADISAGNYHSLLWDFDDGTSSTQAAVNHAFQQAGDYRVLLTLFGPPPQTLPLDTATALVSVGAGPKPGLGPPPAGSRGGVNSPALPRPAPGSGGSAPGGGSAGGLPGVATPQSGSGWWQASPLRFDPLAGAGFSDKYLIVRPFGSGPLTTPLDCGSPCSTEACGLALNPTATSILGLDAFAVAAGPAGVTYLAMTEKDLSATSPREERYLTSLTTLSTGGPLAVSGRVTLDARAILDELSPPIPTSDPAFRQNRASFVMQDLMVLSGGTVVLVGSVKGWFDFGGGSTPYIIERPGLFAISPASGTLSWSLLGPWLEPLPRESLEVKANIVGERFLLWVLRGNVLRPSSVDGILYEGRIPAAGQHLSVRMAPPVVNDLNLVDYGIGPNENIYLVSRQEAPLACYNASLDSYQLRGFNKDFSRETVLPASLDLDYNPLVGTSPYAYNASPRLKPQRRLLLERDGARNVRALLHGAVWPDDKQGCALYKGSPAHPHPAVASGCPDDIINRFCCDDPGVAARHPGVCTGIADEGHCPCQGVNPDNDHCALVSAPPGVCDLPSSPYALEQLLLEPAAGAVLASHEARHTVAALRDGGLYQGASSLFVQPLTLAPDGQGRVIFGGRMINLDTPNVPDSTLPIQPWPQHAPVLIDRQNTPRSIHGFQSSFRVIKHDASLGNNTEESWAWPQEGNPEPIVIPTGAGRLLTVHNAGGNLGLRLYEPSAQWAGVPFADHGRPSPAVTPCPRSATTCQARPLFAAPHDLHPNTAYSECSYYEPASSSNCRNQFLHGWDYHWRVGSLYWLNSSYPHAAITRSFMADSPGRSAYIRIPSPYRPGRARLSGIQARCDQTSETILDSRNFCVARNPNPPHDCTAWELRHRKGYRCDTQNEVFNPIFDDRPGPLRGGWQRFTIANGIEKDCGHVGWPSPVLTVTYPGPRFQVRENTTGNRSTITVDLPRQGNLRVEVVSGDATFPGGAQRAELRNVSGQQTFMVMAKSALTALIKVYGDGREEELAITFPRPEPPCRADSNGFRVCAPRHPGPVLAEVDQPARHAPALAGRNVDLGTRAYWHTETDVIIPSIDIPFVVSRHHMPPRTPSVASPDPSFNPPQEGAELGPGWRLNLIQWLLPITPDQQASALEIPGQGFDMALHAGGRVETFRYPTTGGVSNGPLTGDDRIHLYDEARGELAEKSFGAQVVTYESPRGYDGVLRGYTITPPASGNAGDINPFYDASRPEVGLRDERFFILTDQGGQRRIFNCKGQLIRVISARGHEMQFRYEGPIDRNTGLRVLSGIIDTNGRLSSLHWRMRGSGPKLDEIVLPLGRRLEYRYHTPSFRPARLASVVRNFDARVSLSTSGTPSAIDPPVRLRHGFGYTADSLLKFVFVEMAGGRQVTTLLNHYNGQALVSQETGAGARNRAHSPVQDGGVTRFDYNAAGAIVTDAAGTSWTYTLGDIVPAATTGKVVKTLQVSTGVYNDNMLAPDAPRQELTTVFDYDPAGHIARVDPPGPGSTEFRYNSRGDLTHRIENGTGTSRRIWEWEHHYEGPCVSRTVAKEPSTAETEILYYVFDPTKPGQSCQIQRVINPRVTDPDGTGHTYVTTHEYYGAQQRAGADDRLLRGMPYRETYSEQGGSQRLRQITYRYYAASGGHATAVSGRRAYTKLGLKREATVTGDVPASCQSHVPAERKTLWDYDHRGNLTSITRVAADPTNPGFLPAGIPDTVTEERVYDQADRLYSVNLNGMWTHYTYDERDRVVEIVADQQDMFDGSLLSRPVSNPPVSSRVTRYIYQHSGPAIAVLTGTRRLNRPPDFNSFAISGYDGLDRPVLSITPAGGMDEPRRYQVLSALLGSCPLAAQVASASGPTCPMKALTDTNLLTPAINAQVVHATGAPLRFENISYTRDGLMASQRIHDGTTGLNPIAGGRFSRSYYDQRRLLALHAPGALGSNGRPVLIANRYNDYRDLQESVVQDPEGCATSPYTAIQTTRYEDRDGMGRPQLVLVTGDDGAVVNRNTDNLDPSNCALTTELKRTAIDYDEIGRHQVVTRHVHVLDGSGRTQSARIRHTFGALDNAAIRRVGNKVERSEVDYSGALCAAHTATATGQVTKEVNYKLDGLSRRLRQTVRHRDIEGHGLGEPELTVHFGYDEQGHRSLVRDGLGRETRRYFDAMGRLRAEEVFNDVGTAIRLMETRYDDFGNANYQTTLTDDGRRSVTRTFQDKFLTWESTSLDGEWRSRRRFVLDHEARPIRIHPHGLDDEVLLRELDGVGRLMKETLSLAGAHITQRLFTYNALDRVTRLVARDLSTQRQTAWDETKIYRYNGLGDLTLAQNRISDPANPGDRARNGPVSNVWTTRDSLGKAWEEGTHLFDRGLQTFSTGNLIKAEYDALGLLQRLQYDPDIHRRNRADLAYAYDDVLRLSTITGTSGMLINRFDVKHSGDYVMRRQWVDAGDVPRHTTDYSYDRLLRRYKVEHRLGNRRMESREWYRHGAAIWRRNLSWRRDDPQSPWTANADNDLVAYPENQCGNDALARLAGGGRAIAEITADGCFDNAATVRVMSPGFWDVVEKTGVFGSHFLGTHRDGLGRSKGTLSIGYAGAEDEKPTPSVVRRRINRTGHRIAQEQKVEIGATLSGVFSSSYDWNVRAITDFRHAYEGDPALSGITCEDRVGAFDVTKLRRLCGARENRFAQPTVRRFPGAEKAFDAINIAGIWRVSELLQDHQAEMATNPNNYSSSLESAVYRTRYSPLGGPARLRDDHSNVDKYDIEYDPFGRQVFVHDNHYRGARNRRQVSHRFLYDAMDRLIYEDYQGLDLSNDDITYAPTLYGYYGRNLLREHVTHPHTGDPSDRIFVYGPGADLVYTARMGAAWNPNFQPPIGYIVLEDQSNSILAMYYQRGADRGYHFIEGDIKGFKARSYVKGESISNPATRLEEPFKTFGPYVRSSPFDQMSYAMGEGFRRSRTESWRATEGVAVELVRQEWLRDAARHQMYAAGSMLLALPVGFYFAGAATVAAAAGGSAFPYLAAGAALGVSTELIGAYGLYGSVQDQGWTDENSNEAGWVAFGMAAEVATLGGGRLMAAAEAARMGALAYQSPRLVEGVMAMDAILDEENCFPAGTRVLTENGLVPIERIQVGDRVWSWQEATGSVALQAVENTFENTSDALMSLHVDGHEIEITQGHPIWVEGEGWVFAGNLKDGSRLRSRDGALLPASRQMQAESESTPVYNIQVANWNTYFVEEPALLVHNMSVSRGAGISRNADALRRIRSGPSTATTGVAGLPPGGPPRRPRPPDPPDAPVTLHVPDGVDDGTYVYRLANRNDETIYIGITNNHRRIHAHSHTKDGWTHMEILTGPLPRPHAETLEAFLIRMHLVFHPPGHDLPQALYRLQVRPVYLLNANQGRTLERWVSPQNWQALRQQWGRPGSLGILPPGQRARIPNPRL